MKYIRGAPNMYDKQTPTEVHVDVLTGFFPKNPDKKVAIAYLGDNFWFEGDTVKLGAKSILCLLVCSLDILIFFSFNAFLCSGITFMTTIFGYSSFCGKPINTILTYFLNFNITAHFPF